LGCSEPRFTGRRPVIIPDLIEEAAALWESPAQTHPFIEGNKRTAFAAMYTFLAINGVRLTADSRATYAFVVALYKAN